MDFGLAAALVSGWLEPALTFALVVGSALKVALVMRFAAERGVALDMTSGVALVQWYKQLNHYRMQPTPKIYIEQKPHDNLFLSCLSAFYYAIHLPHFVAINHREYPR